ncbi:hypothetical protein [Terribacillus sp. 7520-G]|uniref:hypothetical protein n=1 Tax=Terribacillus TaxID=459532 RepID=UPI000BA64465|nr:hypothetical protein [Terribacillus sp. 7520-G]PAD40243.1 hypothetical protein CHH53_01730 [Terribacillus sp. 7520-G]
MKELIQKLKGFIPADVQFSAEGSSLRLLTAEGEPCGVVDIDGNGGLIGFDLQMMLPAAAGIDARKIAERFAGVFYPEAADAIQEEQAENSVVIRLAETDPIHRLPIPGAGLSVEVHDSGFVTAAQLYRMPYELIGGEAVMDVEEAKGKLLAEAPIMLAAEGDEAVYKLSDQVIGVHADGTILYAEFPPMLSDIEMEAEPGDWASLMGVTDDFINYHNGHGVQLWAEKSIVDQHPIEEIPDQVAVRKNQDILFYSGATPWSRDRKWTEEELRQQAVRFLAAVADQPLEEWKHAGAQLAADTAIEDELEPAYIFLFAYTKSGIPVEGVEASIHVGIHSGLVRECIIDRVPVAIQHGEPVSDGQAKERIADVLELQLAWIALREENRYELVYVRK